MKRIAIAAALLTSIATTLMCYAHEQKSVLVTIIHREQRDSTYKYEVPGYTAWGCGADIFGQTACTNGVSPSLLVGEYNVSGATLSLLLPDNRVVVANCVAKRRAWHNARDDANTNNLGHYRSCRQPPTDKIIVEFKGDDARLLWPVSIDGTKMQNETYKIIAVLTKKESQ
jgi:hypothetical protein